MATLHVFKNRIPSCNYIFASPGISGKPAIFVGGIYRTNIQAEIDELTHEISLGHPHMFVDEAEVTVDSTLIDPMAALRHKIIEEFKAQQVAATALDNDRGNSDQCKLMPGNTRDIADAASGGSGTSLAARLVNLTQTKSAE